MVKKVKRFLVFLLFSLFYSLLSGKIAQNPNGKKQFSIDSGSPAEAGMCCPKGSRGYNPNTGECYMYM